MKFSYLFLSQKMLKKKCTFFEWKTPATQLREFYGLYEVFSMILPGQDHFGLFINRQDPRETTCTIVSHSLKQIGTFQKHLLRPREPLMYACTNSSWEWNQTVVQMLQNFILRFPVDHRDV